VGNNPMPPLREQSLPSPLLGDRLPRTMLRQSRVVDVVRAIQQVAPGHAEVRCWWYAPPRRVGPGAKRTQDGRAPACVIVIEPTSSEEGASSCESIARELAALLGDVSVRLHLGELEHEPLIRLMSDASRPRHNGVAA